MSYLIRDLPEQEKPRERLKKYGVKSLSNADLISIILRCGTKNKSVKDLSLDILKKYRIKDLKNIDYQTLSKIKGMGEVKALTLISAIELGIRTLSIQDEIKIITNSKDIYEYIRYDLENIEQEKLIAIYLDGKNNIISKKEIFKGTVNKSEVYPRDIFREAVKLNTARLIIVHNHPSGNSNPSNSDIELTKSIRKLSNMIGITLLDHIIIGKNNYYSFATNRGDIFD